MKIKNHRLRLKKLGVITSAASALCFSTALAEDTGAEKQITKSEFVSGAMNANQFELRLAKLAQERTQNPEVEKLATRLANEHQQIKKDLRDLARKYDAKANAGFNQEHRNALVKLEKTSGPEFDRLFVQHVIRDHQQDLDLISKCRERFAGDAAIQSLIAEHTPTVREHLRMARQIADKIGTSDDTAQASEGSSSGAAAAKETGSNSTREREEDSVAGIQFKKGDHQVLGLPTSNTDGTYLGVIPAPSRTVEAGGRQSYIAEELADGKVDKNVENVFDADRDAVATPSTLQRERPASKFASESQVPRQVREALNRRGLDASNAHAQKETVYVIEADGKQLRITQDGRVFEPSKD